MTSFDIVDKLLDIPEREYHAASQCGKYISSHLLADFRRCPEFYHRKVIGEVSEKDTRAYTLGRAVHKLILEGEAAFNETYAVGNGPINPKTGSVFGRATKAYAEWEETQRKPVISTDEKAWLDTLRSAVHAHAEANKLLEQGRAEGVCRAEVEGLPCQIRIDWFSPERGIVDLKTSADLDWFDADARRYGYVHQLAFYRMVLRQATGIEAPCTLLAVEKEEPYRVGVWCVNAETLDTAERTLRAALRRLTDCREIDYWPTGYEQPRYITNL